MTCLIGCDASLLLALANPSFVATACVQFARSLAPIGSGTVDRVPTIIEPTYCEFLAGRIDVGSGYPAALLGPAPSPLALATNSRAGVAVIALGYQPVGIEPSTVPLSTA